MSADEIPAAGSHPVPITNLRLAMDGVHAYSRSQTATADIAHASAFLSYSDLSQALGLAVSADPQAGRIDASAGLPLVGQVTVSAKVAVSGTHSITFQNPEVQGDLPTGADSAIIQALKQPIVLQGLPSGLSLTSVATDGTGVHAELAGTDVTFKTYADSGAAGS